MTTLPGWLVWAAVSACWCFLGWACLAQEQRNDPGSAPPPEWPQHVLDTFFPDAREQLVGERPDYAALAGRSAAGAAADPSDSAAAPGEGFRWSTLVRTETLEDEVKRISSQIGEQVATATAFKGGSFRACRRDFSLLSVLFAVMSEYDQSVRWREDAAAYRDLFARIGFLCQEGNDLAFREAEAGGRDLRNLILGSRIDAEAAQPVTVWPEVADRVPLMQRMEIAHYERLSKWLANAPEFRGNLEDVRHEAELLAMLAEVIAREGYEFADDEEYAQYAERLRQGALEVAEAIASQDYGRASRAVGQITSACNDCHEWFR